MAGNPRIDEMGIAQDNGAMEGKEIKGLHPHNAAQSKAQKGIKSPTW